MKPLALLGASAAFRLPKPATGLFTNVTTTRPPLPAATCGNCDGSARPTSACWPVPHAPFAKRETKMWFTPAIFFV